MGAPMSRLAPRVLVADDQPDVLEALRLLLKPEGFQIETADSPAGVLAAVEAREFDVVLIDLNYTRDTTSGREGLDLLARLQALDPTLPVVVMTAWGSVDLAVEAMRRGARDFVQKPWDNARLLATLRTQVELGRALRRGAAARGREPRAARRGPAAADRRRRAAMQPVLELIERVGPSDANVLVTGENGTGKGTVAAALHAVSARAAQAAPDRQRRRALRGRLRERAVRPREGRLHRRQGRPRGPLRDGRRRHALPRRDRERARRPAGRSCCASSRAGEFERVGSSRTRRADVRLVSATNADLDAEVAAGRFRQDLLFRLNTIEIHVPPLRERREDIPLLAAPLPRRCTAARYRKRARRLRRRRAERALVAHPWPGNVRELDHAVERAVLMARGERVRGRRPRPAPDDASPRAGSRT